MERGGAGWTGPGLGLSNSNICVLPGLNLLHLSTILSLVGHLLRPPVLLVVGGGLVMLETKDWLEPFNNGNFYPK